MGQLQLATTCVRPGMCNMCITALSSVNVLFRRWPRLSAGTGRCTLGRMTYWVFGGALVLGGIAGSGYPHESGEEEHAHKKVTLDQVPAPVRSTLQKEAAGGQIEELR